MKEIIVTTTTLLHKYKRFWIVNLTLVASLGLALASFLPDCFDLVYSSIFLLVMAAWEISDVFLFEKRAIVEEELANEKDKLILAEHDVERLKLELETTQAVLEEVRKRSKAEASVVVETTASDTQDTEPKPKPKRPAFKRKPRPKQTENVNENKD